MSVAEQTNEIIDKIAEKLGVAGEAIQPTIEVLIREYQLRNVISAIACLITSIIIFVGTTKMKKYCLKEYKAELERGKSYSQWDIPAFFAGLFSFVGLGSFIFGAFCYLKLAVSPTFSCLQKILESLN